MAILGSQREFQVEGSQQRTWLIGGHERLETSLNVER
jgi:hypothetical protein